MHTRRGRPRGVAVVVLGVLTAMTCLAGLTGTAAAEPPLVLDTPGQITDRVDALGERRAEVEAALDQLRAEDAVQLFVVYVDSFDGMGSQEWADQTATQSGLGLNDALLAVAVGDRQYAYSVAQDFPLSDAQLAEVATDSIEPRLVDDDWAGAAVAAADGYRAALGSEVGGGSDGGGDDGGGFPWGWLVLAVVAVVGVGALLAWRRARQARGPTGASAGDEAGTEAAPDPYQEVSTDDLGKRAGGLLVETDDAIKTSEQEVAFAEAEFGAEAVVPFHAALATARTELASAFTTWQSLQDSEPEEDPERRTMLIEVLEHCERADQGLDAETARFEDLRDRARRVPEIMASLRTETAAAVARLPDADATVARLESTYPDAAVAAPRADLAQARERLDIVEGLQGEAEASVQGDDANEAVLTTRAAEEALAQARTLLDGVERVESDLAAATERLAALVTEVRKDLAEAEAHTTQGATEPDLTAAVAAARAALAEAEGPIAPTTPAGPQADAPTGIDPIAVSRSLEQADAALDAALGGRRDAKARRDRAAALLDHAIGSARSQIAAVQDYVTTRRGAIGPEARAALAEAQRHLDRAVTAADEDPEQALRDAETAASLAERAAQSARSDTDDYGQRPPSGRMGGGLGGGLGQLGGMVLGGILLDSVLRSGRGGGFGGGFGGGGGRRSGGGFSPGSFGGSSSRRRGGGGRF